MVFVFVVFVVVVVFMVVVIVVQKYAFLILSYINIEEYLADMVQRLVLPTVGGHVWKYGTTNYNDAFYKNKIKITFNIVTPTTVAPACTYTSTYHVRKRSLFFHHCPSKMRSFVCDVSSGQVPYGKLPTSASLSTT